MRSSEVGEVPSSFQLNTIDSQHPRALLSTSGRLLTPQRSWGHHRGHNIVEVVRSRYCRRALSWRKFASSSSISSMSCLEMRVSCQLSADWRSLCMPSEIARREGGSRHRSIDAARECGHSAYLWPTLGYISTWSFRGSTVREVYDLHYKLLHSILVVPLINCWSKKAPMSLPSDLIAWIINSASLSFMKF